MSVQLVLTLQLLSALIRVLLAIGQRVSHIAPAPQEPEASDQIWWSGWDLRWSRSMDTPFHDWINYNHHLMSDWASLLILIILWCVRFAWISMVISLPINDLPGFTTWQAWLRWPRSDSRDSLVHTFLNCHSCSNSNCLLNFSCGSRSSILMVSMSISKKIRHVVRPTVLWGARGIPSFWHTWKIVCWWTRHWSAPSVIKSSREWATWETPLCSRIHWSASVVTVKVIGALHRPKGSAMSRYGWLSHLKPSKRSSLYTSSISILESCVPFPSWTIFLALWSTLM